MFVNVCTSYQKCYIMKELILQKELKLINQRNVWFVIIAILKKIVINLNHMLAYDGLWIKKHCNSEYNVKGVDYGCVLWIMAKMIKLNAR